MNIRLADHRDIDRLTDLRLDFFRECFEPQSAEETARLAEALGNYFSGHLGHDFLAVLAETPDREVAAAAFLTVLERPPSPVAPNGRIGDVGNVLVYPAYRRQGLATRVMSRLIEEARSLGLSRIDLAATPAGRAVYLKLGFVEHGGHTQLQLPLIGGR
jgi:Sortase and related acyltransferases